MILALEGKKIKHTGLLPAFLAGALAVSAFPVINMAFRTDLFISQDLPPVDILLNGNWDMAATFHCFLAILGACILYHTEFANRAIEKLYMLPVNQGKVFFCKNLLLLLLFLPVFLIEDFFFLFCDWHWFPGKDPGVEVLLGNTAFSLAAILPVLLLSTLIASLAKNMWISLGIGVIGMFLGQMSVSYDALFSKVYTFCLPYRCLTSSARAEDIFQILGICAAETVVFAVIKLFLIKIRRQPV